jgi:uncharacterized protein (DUF2141 family)
MSYPAAVAAGLPDSDGLGKSVVMKCVLTVAALLAVLQIGSGADAADRAASQIEPSAPAATADASTMRSGATGMVRGTAELRVNVEGFRSSHGVVLIGLYDSAKSFDRAIELAGADGFLNDPDRVAGAALRMNPALTGGVIFSNLKPGRYALIVFHDENANGRLDKNFFGVPTEPYGFSNDAQGFLGAPSFDDAAILLGAHDEVAIIDLIYHAGGIQTSSDQDPDARAAVGNAP